LITSELVELEAFLRLGCQASRRCWTSFLLLKERTESLTSVGLVCLQQIAPVVRLFVLIIFIALHLLAEVVASSLFLVVW
jgi:hypothetical protein